MVTGLLLVKGLEMPWTVDDVDRFNHGLSEQQKKQWVAIANSVLERCLNDGGEQEECEALAIKQANGVIGHGGVSNHYRNPTRNYEIRYEMHQRRRHMVVPVVMMTEGVHHGSHGPLLHLADDLAKFPGAWNGIPISVHHPEEDGVSVSANQPEVIDSQVVGRVYNTVFDNGKLKAEAWIDEELIKNVSPEAYQYLLLGKPLDVSIGVFTEEEYKSGEWNGEYYEAIAHNHRPDHLALLPGGVGACSWADGCGVRINEEGGMKIYGLEYNGTESTAWSSPTLGDFGVDGRWEDLSQTERARIANHYLIGSADAIRFEELKFPVVNPETGKLNEMALRAVISGRGAQANIPTSQRRSARRTAYRLLNSEFDAGLEIPDNLSEMIKELVHLGFSVNELGYMDISQRIQDELDQMDDDVKVHFLEQCYDDYFVYRVDRRDNQPSEFYKCAYYVDGESIEFVGDPELVVKKIEYVMMKKEGEKEGKVMPKKHEKEEQGVPCCPEKVELLIQDERTHFEEADREWLLTLDEKQIAKLEPIDVLVHEQEIEKQREELLKMSQEQAVKVLEEKFSDPQKAMSLFPREIREQMEHGLRLYRQHRSETIEHILGNTDVFTNDELENKPIDELEKLARAIKPKTDFSLASPVTHKIHEQDILLPMGVE